MKRATSMYGALGCVAIGILVSAATWASTEFDEGYAAYHRGDFAEAVRCYRLAAEQGNAEAQISLGYMYRRGQGVPRDYTEALRWLRLAAEQGNAEAQFNLGYMYDGGQGVPQDYTEALRWYRLAADQGYAAAQVNLGYMYYAGQGVPQDYVYAHMWLSLASAGGVENARAAREAVADLMTPDQMTEAQRLAREWYSRSRQ